MTSESRGIRVDDLATNKQILESRANNSLTNLGLHIASNKSYGQIPQEHTSEMEYCLNRFEQSEEMEKYAHFANRYAALLSMAWKSAEQDFLKSLQA